ncbi:hypothetical protein [Nonomuraea sp. NPDC001831]|uniref:hypothetical protein n=1 Tax=Nonomuraea sp. NPDC001831 TaxID=3364340 RepID=UPI0036B66569
MRSRAPAGVPPDGRPVEIACDESGAEGEKLVGGNTDVFAHAGVSLDVAAAADCVRELRLRAPSPVTEYKAGHVLREKNRATLVWLLGPSGPILGRARVHLTDKAYFAVSKVTDLLAGHHSSLGLDQDERSAARAVTLYQEGRRAFGPARWTAFLDAFNHLLRARNGRGPEISADAAFELVADLRTTPGPAGEIMDELWAARPLVDAFTARLLDDPHVFPALDPLIPAIAHAVAHWGAGGRPVSVVHDRQTTLTEERVERLRQLLARPNGPVGPLVLTSLTLVASHLDPRVQVADIVAGVARKIASEELNGRGDPELTGLLRPYVDLASVWPDERSRAALIEGQPSQARASAAASGPSTGWE